MLQGLLVHVNPATCIWNWTVQKNIRWSHGWCDMKHFILGTERETNASVGNRSLVEHILVGWMSCWGPDSLLFSYETLCPLSYNLTPKCLTSHLHVTGRGIYKLRSTSSMEAMLTQSLRCNSLAFPSRAGKDHREAFPEKSHLLTW